MRLRDAVAKFQSPHGRGGSCITRSRPSRRGRRRPWFQSPHGRGGSCISCPDCGDETRWIPPFQSPHGRGGSCIVASAAASPKSQSASFNPLMVGAVPASQKGFLKSISTSPSSFNPLMVGAVPASDEAYRYTGTTTGGFNPLMVGAVPASKAVTETIYNEVTRVSIPSWSGRFLHPYDRLGPPAAGSEGFNPLMVGAVPASHGRPDLPHGLRQVSIPSWSGRFLHRTAGRARRAGSRRFQSPHGRGGSCIPQRADALVAPGSAGVSIPSWSGRFLHLELGAHRPAEAGQFQSPHGRGGSCILRVRRSPRRCSREFQSPHGRGGSCIQTVEGPRPPRPRVSIPSWSGRFLHRAGGPAYQRDS